MTKTQKFLAVFAVIMLAFVGLAWAENVSIQRTGWLFKGGLWVGSSSASTNKITNSLGGRVDYTFPALPDDGGTTGNACAFSAWGATCGSTAGTCTGATVGDPCSVGVGYGSSGVLIAGQDDQFDCSVTSANTVKVRRCGPRGAGALVDAGYSVRVTSSQ